MEIEFTHELFGHDVTVTAELDAGEPATHDCPEIHPSANIIDVVLDGRSLEIDGLYVRLFTGVYLDLGMSLEEAAFDAATEQHDPS